MSAPVLVFTNPKARRASSTMRGNVPPLLNRKLRWLQIYDPHAFSGIERLIDDFIDSFRRIADTDEDLEALRELPGERRP